MDNRMSWEDYFFKIMDIVAERSTCLRRKVGAIFVKDKRILVTGYNGAPSGITHCLDVGCLRDKMEVPSGQRHELCRAVHAEQNAIVQASVHGVSLFGSVLYVPVNPCSICMKMLINVGVKAIYCREEYPDELSLELLRESNIEMYLQGGLR